MFNEDIMDWVEKFGSVTTHTFMVFGDFTVKDNAIINKGLTLTLVNERFDTTRYIQLVRKVENEEAEESNIQRGWNLQWVFPGDFQHEFVPMLISDGLTHLRLKHEYLGMFRSDVSV